MLDPENFTVNLVSVLHRDYRTTRYSLRHLSKGDIFSMLKFDNILLPIDDFEAPIRMESPNVTSIKPAHAFLINLCQVEKSHVLLINRQKQIYMELKKIKREKWHAHNFKCENYLEHFISFILILKITRCHTETANYNLSSWHWFVRW